MTADSSLLPSDLGLPPRFTKYRRGQDTISLDLAASESRFLPLCASTGSGKSIINLSVSRLLSARTLFLVSTKALQSQLLADFQSIGLYGIEGHTNYSCAETRYDDSGDLLDLECYGRRSGGDCLYYQAVDHALKSDMVVTNYAHWVTLAKSEDADRLGKFDLIVLDEAHSVLDLLTDLLSVKLLHRTIETLLDRELPSATDSIEPIWVMWLSAAVSKARTVYNDLRRTYASRGDKSDSANRELARLTKLGKDLARLHQEVSRTPSNWVVESIPRGVRLSPVWPGVYAESYLYRGIPRVLLTSATLTKTAVKYLGIRPSTYDYHELASTFDPSRRPVIYVPTTRVDHRMNEGQTRVWLNRIDSIIDGRLDRKGILHSRSYRRAHEIATRSRHQGADGLLLTHTSESTRQVIQQFKSSDPPSVLISPAVDTGHDFPGLECSYQIISKLPFLDTRSPITKARVDSDKSYSSYVTAQSIIQMAGRGMRSADDLSENLVIDDHWAWFRGRADFPRWFRQSFKQSDRVPSPPPLTKRRIVSGSTSGR